MQVAHQNLQLLISGSASAAMDKGVTLSDILHMADWSSGTTFQRFYYRPVKDATYAHHLTRIITT